MTLNEEIQNWLEKQGYSLEMRTSAAFREAGFEVRQSSYCLDPETNEGREINMIAIDPDILGAIKIQFVIECKATQKPWVLLSSLDTVMGYNRYFAYGILSEKALDAYIERGTELIDSLPWLEKEGLIGYSLREAFSDGKDIAQSVGKSIANACEFIVRPPNEKYIAPYIIVFPIIVVNTPLFECSLQNDGNLKLEEVDKGEFLFPSYKPKSFGACIRVITEKYLQTFAKEAKTSAEKIREAFKLEEREFLKSFSKK